jgi:hypothetical protein
MSRIRSLQSLAEILWQICQKEIDKMEDAIGNVLKQDSNLAQIPDLDWVNLPKDNIPSEFPVEAIPQLQQAWTHTNEPSTRLISNAGVKGGMTQIKTASQEDISGVVKQAKKEMMMGYVGKSLADRLASMYMPDLILAAKDELLKIAGEQGLLGNVYIDLTPYDSCHDAAVALGKNRIRTARYVVGKPARHVCSSHPNGFCKELNKRVATSMEYSDAILKEYTTHLRIAGVINASDSLTSKEALRDAFLVKPIQVVEPEIREASVVDTDKFCNDFAVHLEKNAAEQEKQAAVQKFFASRTILAHLQNQMLKGKVGESLKSSLREKFSSNDIAKYAQEIAKVASLQGMLGNIYVDVSYYKTPEDAIQAIKTASTNPYYLIQSYKVHSHDNTLAKVASATGCTEFPRDGKLDKKVVFSYIKDLQANNKLSSSMTQGLINRVMAGESSLDVIKDAFDASTQYKKEVRIGGVQGTYAPGVSKQALDRKELTQSVYKALEAGIAVDLIEDKIAGMIGTSEAVGLVHDALTKVNEVCASSLSKCTSDKYSFSRAASLRPAQKCIKCVLKSASVCLKQSLRFVGAMDLDKAFFDFGKEAEDKPDIDKNTKAVQLKENPDVTRKDICQEYDMSDPFGSGMNIALDNMQEKKEACEIELGVSSEGMDRVL